MVFYVVRYSEIGLKGKNRPGFERKLASNIRISLKNKGLDAETKALRGRILLNVQKKASLRTVFGISSYSQAEETGALLSELKQKALKIAGQSKKTTTFRISTQRINKDYPLASPEINNQVGQHLVDKTGMSVDLEEPDLDICIEILGGKAWFFTSKTQGPGGLPVGTQGKALLLLNSEAAVLAGLLVMKRGCSLDIAITDALAQKKYLALLQSYHPAGIKTYELKNLSDLNKNELNKVLEQAQAKALVVPDTLDEIQDYPVGVGARVLRPLIALTDKQIGRELEKYKRSASF